MGPVEWLTLAEQREGSWWPEWWRWLDQHSGRPTAPPPLGASGEGVLGDAPGQYVLEH